MPTYREMFDFIIEGDLSKVATGLDGGFDVNEADQYGFLLIHRACANHAPDIVSLLIARGSKLEQRATDEWTPLHLAAVSGAAGCPRLLVGAGASPNVRDKNGCTPLYLSITSRNPEVASELIELGALKDAKNLADLTPLELARERKAAKFYKVLS